MAIEPINPASLTPVLTAARRRDPAGAARPLNNPQLQQMMQTGRETSALLSTLPGPNESFFAAPGPLQFAGAGPGAFQPGQRLNTPLLETEQLGRENATLLSTLMAPGPRAFQPPVPPRFQAEAGPGAAPPGGAGAAPAGSAQTGMAAMNPATSGAAAGALGGALPRAGAQLLETEQQGRINSVLLSGLTGPAPQAVFSRPEGASAGSALATMRTAQQIIQEAGMAPPSTENMRIANDAYRMEARAQRDFQIQGGMDAGRREWFA